MAKANRSIICKHCKKQIKGKAKLIGLTIICPYCERPSEDLQKEVSMNTLAQAACGQSPK
jgi:uncharacterized CHY-type Zn-finger protein